jgi:hypothetical protein
MPLIKPKFTKHVIEQEHDTTSLLAEAERFKKEIAARDIKKVATLTSIDVMLNKKRKSLKNANKMEESL